MNQPSQNNNQYVPVVLSLILIAAGVLLAIIGNYQNPLHKFCFAILMSLGTGLAATYLTGTMIGEGKFGFINVKSMAGGFAVWAITLATFIYFSPNENKIPPTMAGKWIYVCSGHDGKYQHGGRFIATQNGGEWNLKGERMWKDLKDTSNNWECAVYNPTKSWHSVFAYVDKEKVRFEYVVENVNGEDIHGYSSGEVTLNKNNEVVKIKGIFNQLFPSKQISGDIEFFRVDDKGFENPKWARNHSCKSNIQ